MHIEKVAERAYNLLKGFGFIIQSHNLQGEIVVDPSEATRFMIDEPNILVRLDPSDNTLTLNTSEDLSDPQLRTLHKMLKRLAQDYLLTFDYNVFGRTIKPSGESQNIAKNAEKDMADVMEALNRMMQLAGLEEANQNQQASVYNPDGTTYRQQKMPHLDPNDPMNKAQGLDAFDDDELGYEPDLGKDVFDGQRKKQIAKLISTLSDEDREVLILHFGLEGNKDHNFSDLADRYGLDGIMAARKRVATAMRNARRNLPDQSEFGVAGFGEGTKPGETSVNTQKNTEKNMTDVMEEINRIKELSGLIEAKEDCPKCKGSGKKDGKDCKSCSGAGTMYLDGPDYDKEEMSEASDDIMDKHKKVDNDMDDYGSEIEFDSMDDPDDADYQSVANRRHRKDRSKKKNGSYAKVSEASLSRMTGSAKTSKQQLENVKIVVKHKNAVNEESRGSRSRNIHSIFIERAGERFKMTENNLQAARAMVRHISMGGEMHDSVGVAINEMATECKKMKEFVRYVNSAKLINEDNAEYMQLAVEHIGEIKNKFKKLSGSSTYSQMAESIANAEPMAILEDDDDIQSKFTETHFDPKISNVMGNLASLSYKKKAFETYITSAIKKESFNNLTSMLHENDAIDFASPQAQLSHQVSQLGYSAVDEQLGAYLHNVSSKISSGGGLSQHEYGTIKSCLSVANGTIAPSVATQDVTETYEMFFDQFND